MSYKLVLKLRTGYPRRLDEAARRLEPYRRAEGIDWPPRIEDWLRNFQGMVDQDTALSLIEGALVLSEADLVTACGELLERLRAAAGEERLFHLMVETSGGALLRILEKHHRVRHYEVLRGRDLFVLGQQGEDAEALSARLRKLTDGYRVVIWDTFLGTGGQMRQQRQRYAPIFAGAAPRFGGLRFAFIAGHPSEEADVFLWRETPVWNSAQQELNERYAPLTTPDARRLEGRRAYETGALVVFPDNPPNNTPLVLRAPAAEGWATLLDRRDTPIP